MEAQVKDRFTTYEDSLRPLRKDCEGTREKDFQVNSREDFDSYVVWKGRGN